MIELEMPSSSFRPGTRPSTLMGLVTGLKRLKAVFPEGVCDWTRKGVGQTTMVPWASFGPAPENLVFDINAQR